MRSIDGNLAAVQSAGYAVSGHFPLPDSAWRDEYYAPLAKRIQSLKDVYHGNEIALELLALEEHEMEMHRKFSAYYGYVFYVMRNGA